MVGRFESSNDKQEIVIWCDGETKTELVNRARRIAREMGIKRKVKWKTVIYSTVIGYRKAKRAKEEAEASA